MKKKQILIVEDERIVADDVKVSLQRLGYDVCGIAVSGEEAIKKAEQTHPDLVLMDIILAGEIDGIKAAAIINSRFDIPVVYLTAYTDTKTLDKAKITEPFGYILKPFEDRDLHTAIEIALYRHKMMSTLEERYRSVITNAQEAIYVIIPDGFQYANPAFEKLVGLKKEELFNKEFNFLNVVHPDDLKLVKERKKAWKRGEEELTSYKFRIISKDGEVKKVEATMVNIGIKEDVRELGILKDITEPKRGEKEYKQSSKMLQKSMEDTVNALASALEMRDPYTAGHQYQVANLACAIAKEMGLPDDQIEAIHIAGIIHDIGKISIPAEILGKPSRLSEIEMELIKNHTKVSHNILKDINFPYPVAQIVLQHHERMDGSGYPEGLAGEEILLEARILAVADVVEAMSSSRPYRLAFTIDKVLEEICLKRDVLYDPAAVDACVKLFSEKRFKFE